jgi:hypothetical protein
MVAWISRRLVDTAFGCEMQDKIGLECAEGMCSRSRSAVCLDHLYSRWQGVARGMRVVVYHEHRRPSGE